MVNSINLIGRLTDEPEFKADVGKGLTTFTIAIDDRYSDYTSFIDCQSWGKTAENIANHFHKGKQIGVTGRIKQDRWEKEGQKCSKVVVVVENFTFCGKKDD